MLLEASRARQTRRRAKVDSHRPEEACLEGVGSVAEAAVSLVAALGSRQARSCSARLEEAEQRSLGPRPVVAQASLTKRSLKRNH